MMKSKAKSRTERKPITKTRKRELEKQIEMLRSAEEKAYGQRHGRYDFYGYLRAVLEVYWDWKDRGARKTLRLQLCQLYKITPRKGHTALHAIVAASSEGDTRRQSRWVRALRFAAKHRVVIEKQGFKKFCNDHGGIPGCANEWTKMKNDRAMPRGKSAGGKTLDEAADDDWND